MDLKMNYGKLVEKFRMLLASLPTELLQEVADFLGEPRAYHCFKVTNSLFNRAIRPRMLLPLETFNLLKKRFGDKWDPGTSRKFLLSDALCDNLIHQALRLDSEYHLSDVLCRVRPDYLCRYLSFDTIRHLFLESCRRGFIWICSYLIDSGFITNTSLAQGFTLAVESSRLEIFAILSEGGYLDFKTINPQTMGTFIQNGGKYSIFRRFLHLGFDLDSIDLRQIFPTHPASDRRIIRHILMHHQDWPNMKQSIWFSRFACRGGDVTLLRILLESGASIEVNACLMETQSPEIVKFLVSELGADINSTTEQGETILVRACSGADNLELVKTILKLGARIQGSVGTQSLEASVIRARSTSIANQLIKYGVDINCLDARTKRSILHKAVAERVPPHMIDFLMRKGINVNPLDVYGRTPLMTAAEIGDPTATATLIKWGAITDLVDNYGDTAINLAEVNNHSPVVMILRECGRKHCEHRPLKRRRKGEFF
jgi:hypothetical protein